MKILYGINGTGNGHITKSLNIISNLNKLGYKNIDILISGNNHSLNIPYKYKFHGFSLKYNQYGSIDYLKTLKDFKPLQFIKDISIENFTEICMEAVKQNGLALEYIKNQTPEICTVAVNNTKRALYYVSKNIEIVYSFKYSNISTKDLIVDHKSSDSGS